MRYLCCFLFVTLAGCIELEGSPEERSPEEGVVGNTAVLEWTEPSRLEDETSLESDDISAYYIHWGNSAENLENTEKVIAEENKLVLSGLPSGSYFFSVSVETVSGNRSLPSNVVTKVFN